MNFAEDVKPGLTGAPGRSGHTTENVAALLLVVRLRMAVVDPASLSFLSSMDSRSLDLGQSSHAQYQIH